MKQYNSLYSVIIPVFNGLKFIEKCLNDHLKQSLLPNIIIIIDDGSSRDQRITISSINKILNNKLEFKLISHKKNMGTVSAIRTGLNYVNTKYFKISAVDDLLEKDCAKKSLNLITKNPQAGYVFSMPSMFVYKNNKIKKYKLNISKTPKFFNSDEFKKITSKRIFKIYSNTIFFDTEKFLIKNLFDQRYDFLADLINSYYLAFKYGVCFVPEHLAHYGVHEKQLSQNVRDKSSAYLKVLMLLKLNENKFYKAYIKSSLAYDVSPLDLIKTIFTENKEIFSIKVFYRSLIFNLWSKTKYIIPPFIVSVILRYF